MLLLPLLLCFSPSVLGQPEESQFGDDVDSELADFEFDIAPRRVPRQVKTILSKETKPHIQELSIKTTIISRYAFTAVHCAMLNRHSAAAEGVFQFQIPAGAYVSNFTIPEVVEVFWMAASIPGRNRALFLLTYEELLRRRLVE